MNLDKKSQDCHGREKENKGMKKHGLMMMLCCLIPFVLIAGIPLFGLEIGSLSFLIFLLCPLMHVGMMFTMKKDGHSDSCHGSKNKDTQVHRK